jgi:hypothetical protein
MTENNVPNYCLPLTATLDILTTLSLSRNTDMLTNQTKISIFVILYSLVILALFALFYTLSDKNSDALNELHIREANLKIIEAQLRIAQLKRNLSPNVLTLDDIENLYRCVDIKIENQHSEDKYPCDSLRGDRLIGHLLETDKEPQP